MMLNCYLQGGVRRAESENSLSSTFIRSSTETINRNLQSMQDPFLELVEFNLMKVSRRFNLFSSPIFLRGKSGTAKKIR